MAWIPAFKELLQSFNAEKVRNLLVGGYAVAPCMDIRAQPLILISG